MNNLHDSVERWLVQDGYSIIETKTEDNFKIIIKNIYKKIIIMKRSTLKKILVLANVFGASLIIIVVLLP